MTPQRLDRVLTCYRVGDPDGIYPIFDAAGSTSFPGRWNEPDTPLIYTSEHYATAILEKLAHASGLMPRNQHWIAITVPNGASFEVVTRDHLPGWDTPEPTVARTHGAKWARERRSLLLLVPSYVARLDRNVLINPGHPEFAQLRTSLPEPVWWDERLFQGNGPATSPKRITAPRPWSTRSSSAADEATPGRGGTRMLAVGSLIQRRP